MVGRPANREELAIVANELELLVKDEVPEPISEYTRIYAKIDLTKKPSKMLKCNKFSVGY